MRKPFLEKTILPCPSCGKDVETYLLARGRFDDFCTDCTNALLEQERKQKRASKAVKEDSHAVDYSTWLNGDDGIYF